MAESTLARIQTKQLGEGTTQRITVGRCYYIKGPRNDYVGRVVEVLGPYTVSLESASWVASSGRLHLFILNGRGDSNVEIEPVGSAPCVQVQDAFDWPHPLFREPIHA